MTCLDCFRVEESNLKNYLCPFLPSHLLQVRVNFNSSPAVFLGRKTKASFPIAAIPTRCKAESYKETSKNLDYISDNFLHQCFLFSNKISSIRNLIITILLKVPMAMLIHCD